MKFIPDVGVLVTRVLIDYSGNSEFLFCYRDIDEDDVHYKAIAVIRNFNSKPNFYGFVECCNNISSQEPHVHRHVATYEELLALKSLWDSKTPLDDWLDEVNDASLGIESKARLQSIFKE